MYQYLYVGIKDLIVLILQMPRCFYSTYSMLAEDIVQFMSAWNGFCQKILSKFSRIHRESILWMYNYNVFQDKTLFMCRHLRLV